MVAARQQQLALAQRRDGREARQVEDLGFAADHAQAREQIRAIGVRGPALVIERERLELPDDRVRGAEAHKLSKSFRRSSIRSENTEFSVLPCSMLPSICSRRC